MPTTTFGRRAQPLTKGEERESALVKAAEALLEQGTYADASVSELAVAAGLTRPTFYFYFASKDALLASVIGSAHADIANRLETALSGPGTPVDRLADAISAAADAWWDHRAAMSAAMEMSQRMPGLAELMRAATDRADELCVELLMVHGTVPERTDREAALALVRTLALLNERILAGEISTAARRADLRPAERRLLTIWVRVFGLPGST
jgi:AcrR family transcriptional regulator